MVRLKAHFQSVMREVGFGQFVLMLVEQVVHLPELSLPRRRLGRLCGH